MMGKVNVTALNNISLEIPRRKFNVVIGASGSGKTTLLNLLGCIDIPTTGDIEVCGQAIAKLNDNALADFRAKNIGFIFQNFNLIPVFSTYENVEYPLLLTKIPAAERRERTLRILDAVGLSKQQSRRPNELSGGQRQRVAVARALVKNPELVLADEPTANLDSKTGHSILELMRAMQMEFHTTFIFSSHDRQLMERADETFVIQDGELIQHVPACLA
jgi:putative ABC transport system ATP-binding protein